MARYQAGQDPRKQRKNKDQLKASIRITDTGPGKYRAQLRNDGDPGFYYNGKPLGGYGRNGDFTARPTNSWTGRKEFDLKGREITEFENYVREQNREADRKKRNRKF
jgi:hypothetical protein